MRNRKVWLYIIAVAAIVLLNFFEKDGSSAIVTLTGLYFGANVGAKLTNTNKTGETKNEQKDL